METYSHLLITVLAIINTIAYFKNRKLSKEINLLQEDNTIKKQKLQSLEEDTKKRWEQQFKAWCITKEKTIRQDTIARSRNIIRGQATEHLAPIMMKDYSLKDFRFIGNPIDFIIYNGLGNLTDGKTNEIESIVFLDIKTGNSKLNKVQRRIRDCIKNGNVEFLIYNPDKEKNGKKNLE